MFLDPIPPPIQVKFFIFLILSRNVVYVSSYNITVKTNQGLFILTTFF